MVSGVSVLVSVLEVVEEWVFVLVVLVCLLICDSLFMFMYVFAVRRRMVRLMHPYRADTPIPNTDADLRRIFPFGQALILLYVEV